MGRCVGLGLFFVVRHMVIIICNLGTVSLSIVGVGLQHGINMRLSGRNHIGILPCY